MHRPYREDRKRRFSEMEQVYCGPEEFMEAGVRGFLITTQADKEEFAVDDAIDLLRQASIMIYGGFKPRTKNADHHKGYVPIDFMDPGDVQILPLPEGEEESANEEEEKKETTEDGDKLQEDQGNTEESTKTSQAENKTEDAEKQTPKKPYKKKKAKEEEEKNYTYMRCLHKFKAFRTEIRSMLFIKSNVPDPLELASAAMQLVLKRRAVAGDAVMQLLPVQGVCDFDLLQLEIMTKRVLQPYFDETLPPKSFNVMIFDKISEPGTDILAETVRNTIWSMNPCGWMTSPLTEPDALIRVELIGSKLVLCCLDNFMMYRQYSPSLLATLGPGVPEDDDGTDMNKEMRQEYEEEQRRIEQRRREYEERRQREEEERQRLAAEKRAYDEERRKIKLEEKKKREETRKIREEENRKRREERKKKLEEEKKKKAQEEEKKAKEADEGGGAEKETESKDEQKEEEGGAKGEGEADISLNKSLNESGDADMASDSEDKEKARKRGKRGGRGKGRGKAKK